MLNLRDKDLIYFKYCKRLTGKYYLNTRTDR